MVSNLIIFGDSRKGTTYEEEKAFFDFYCKGEIDSVFEFRHLKVAFATGSTVCILKNPVLKSPTEKCSLFTFSAEPYNFSTVVKNPCDIPKVMVPFDDADEVLMKTLSAIRKIYLP